MTTYSKEFKDQALKLSDEIGLKKASDQLGVKYSTLSGWRRNRSKKSINVVQKDTTPMTDRELKMQKEIQELKQANEILKDALGFFAKDRKK
ncbi:transposase [Thiospirochaeta perfilievii]|uniref:Transposase n=1 Tax=Thiospirochaeta perfilievii TaxID=252967 RepID=A0A5C1QBF4_9SPIO|nr:transposase [Thiospirochaeta perfilievii]QEN04199.1 transposase [Thiospirochaeta perfilievii]QEN05210.1 transposase [Thiospirochaeta perfilievii]